MAVFSTWHPSVLPALLCCPGQMTGYYLWNHNKESFRPQRTPLFSETGVMNNWLLIQVFRCWPNQTIYLNIFLWKRTYEKHFVFNKSMSFSETHFWQLQELIRRALANLNPPLCTVQPIEKSKDWTQIVYSEVPAYMDWVGIQSLSCLSSSVLVWPG